MTCKKKLVALDDNLLTINELAIPSPDSILYYNNNAIWQYFNDVNASISKMLLNLVYPYPETTLEELNIERRKLNRAITKSYACFNLLKYYLTLQKDKGDFRFKMQNFWQYMENAPRALGTDMPDCCDSYRREIQLLAWDK